MEPLKLVPFNPQWVTALGPSGTPLLDIHAIYRRPHLVKGPDGEWVRARDEAGFGEWAYIGGSPMCGQNHRRKTTRGFEYVTLARRDDLAAVANPDLAAQGVSPLLNWQEYVQNPTNQGPFWPPAYREYLKAEKIRLHEELIRDIREHGPEHAERLRQRDDPEYRIPAAFLAKVQADAPTAAPTAEPTVEPDPRDAEIADLKAQLAEATKPKRRGRPPKRKPTALVATEIPEGVDA